MAQSAKVPAVRERSLASAVKAAGGIDAWNSQNDELSSLDRMIEGLCQASSVDQVLTEVKAIQMLGHDLWAYAYMRKLYNINEALYFGALLKDPIALLPVVYTPTVGEACQKFGNVPVARRGCYVSLADRTDIKGVLEEYAALELEKGPDGKPICECIVFSDGGRVLGLGDLGAWGMGIPIGKLDLYCACAGVNPNRTIPVIIDVGIGDADKNTANLGIRDHPLYTGLKQDRVVTRSKAGTVVNKAYHGDDSFIEEFMASAQHVFGPEVLLQFEDFNSNDAFPLLERCRNKFVAYNDDIQGTAAVAIAGLMGAMRIKRPALLNIRDELKKERFLFHGAGSANIGTMKLLVELGVPKTQIFVTNSRGVVWKSPDGSDGSFRNEEQKEFAQEGKPAYNPLDLCEAIKAVKATCLVGAVGRAPDCFDKPVVEAMVEVCKPDRPVIFAMSNPKTQAEITSTDAYNWSGGTAIYGSGTKMPEVQVAGELRSPAQVNNVYIFPGVSMGVIRCQAKSVPESFFLAAAEAVANALDVEDMRADRVLPSLTRIRQVGLAVAAAVVMEAQKAGLAGKNLGDSEIIVKHALKAAMWVPAGSEELHATSLPLPDIPEAPTAQPTAAAPAPVKKRAGRQLPVDSELNDYFGGSSKIRAVRISIDKRRPRYVAAGTIPASDSIAKDFERIAVLLEGSEPGAILVYLPDRLRALQAKDTDWVIITYIPPKLKKREEMQWMGAGDSFISNYPEKRIQEWRVTNPAQVSYFAFCEVAKAVVTQGS